MDDNIRQEIMAAVINAGEADSNVSQQYTNSTKEHVELDGRKRFFDLRDKWSGWIVTWISAFILFHIAVTFGIGFKWLDFQTHVWLLPGIIIENFLQVVGMGYVVIKFLYPEEKKPDA